MSAKFVYTILSAMKGLLLIFLSLVLTDGWSQDTLRHVNNPDGSRTFVLVQGNDTLLKGVYGNGVTESVVQQIGGVPSGRYTRYYENGEKMWERQLVKSIPEGRSVFYNSKGKRIAELQYERGVITDTLYVKPGIHLIIGRLTFTSKVYGGMEREDGGSNISENSGPFRHQRMYTVKVDSSSSPKKLCSFTSDRNGDFITTVPNAAIGFFTAETDLAKIPQGAFCPPPAMHMSGNDGWSMSEPLNVNGRSIILFELNHFSVGYAP